MATFKIALSSTIEDAVKRAQGRVSDLSPVLRPLGILMYQAVAYNVRNWSGRDLAASTRTRDKYKDKKSYSGRKARPADAARRPLILAGGLVNSNRFDFGKDWVSAINDAPHAHFFVTGTVTRPQNKQFDFMFISTTLVDRINDDVEDYIVGELGDA